ncbi:MAG: hypothetical protein ABSC05_20820 [Candidatus Solibacter sp.]|jgi:hypothetical protein
MRILNSALCLSIAAAACITGCGRQERMEAVQLAKALTAKKADYANSNKTEKDFVESARAWCTGITTNGAGRGAELDQNSSVATQIAQSAAAVSAQLSQVRQVVDDLPLKEEFPKEVRNTLITQLTKRQRTLQDMRALLEASAPQFLEYRKIKTYVGDTYPDGIGKLDTMLGTYQEPEDAIATALAALKKKYSLADSEL